MTPDPQPDTAVPLTDGQIDAIRDEHSICVPGYPCWAKRRCDTPRLIATIDSLTTRLTEAERERDEALAIDPDNPSWGTKNKSRGQLRLIIRNQHRIAKANHAAVTLLNDRADAAEQSNRELREALERIATCKPHYPGDVVSIARAALNKEPS